MSKSDTVKIPSSNHNGKSIPYSVINDCDYLAMMRHEIGTPLNAIVGFSYILSNIDCSPQKKVECAEMLRDSSNMLMGLMKNMLDSSQMESGLITVENAPFDVIQTVREAVNIITPMAEEKGLGIHVHVSHKVPQECIGDSLRIRQILLNLLTNAVRFTSKGRIDIHIDTKTVLNGNNQLTIRVADTGIGIDRDFLKTVFGKCVQGPAIAQQKYGSGLGLYISQGLAHIMHGNITAKSLYGKGSQFTLTLPLKVPPRCRPQCRCLVYYVIILNIWISYLGKGNPHSIFTGTLVFLAYTVIDNGNHNMRSYYESGKAPEPDTKPE